MRSMIKGLLLAAAVMTATAACGDDESDSGSDAKLTIADAWARTSPMNVKNGAAYMLITSPSDDALVGASVDASIAAKVEIHETVAMEPETDSSSMPDSTGMTGSTMPGGDPEMQMRPIAKLALTAGEPMLLKPGGYHIMLLDLAAPLELDSTFELTLTFEKAGTKTVEVTVRDDAP